MNQWPGTTAGGFDLAQTDQLLTTTRAVRKRLDLTRPVAREVVVECLRIATQAPTGGNSQPWRWQVVDDPELRSGLAGLYRRGYERYIAALNARIGSSGRSATAGIIESSDYLAQHLHLVPMLVVPCRLGRLPTDAGVAGAAGFYGSILPAVWSFMLALRSRGIGSTWTTNHLRYERDAAQLLGIPDTVTQVALIPVAHYTGAGFKPGRRRPVEQDTDFNGWRRRR